jgi:two-component system sensor histidine kinase EvgS
MASKILIADDDMASCLILRKMLTDLGFCCDVVHNGVDAVHAACGKHYDMFLLDLYMPVLSGIHAAIAIRSLRPTNPAIPMLIGISSSLDCNEASLCKVAGMAGILLKPFSRESIARLIQTFRTQPATAVHEAKAHEDGPRNAHNEPPDDHVDPDDHVPASRSSSPACRTAIYKRATSVIRKVIRKVHDLRSRGSLALMRSSFRSHSCALIPRKTRQGQIEPDQSIDEYYRDRAALRLGASSGSRECI